MAFGRTTSLRALLAIAALLAGPGPGVPSARAAAGDHETGRGRALYRRACAPCHGAAGDGKGPAARYIAPRPRDFTLGEFKLRTTEGGEPPSDDDLLRVITRGVPGTGMPAWGFLSEEDRRSLVRTVKSFSPVFAAAERAPRRIDTSGRPDPTADSIALGRAVFEDLQCAKCHGDSGGKSLSQGWRFRGGTEPEDIFCRLLAGMDGTPMPSFASSFPLGDDLQDIALRIEDGDTLTPEERREWEAAQAGIRERVWHLVNYVRSLSRRPGWFREAFLRDTEETR